MKINKATLGKFSRIQKFFQKFPDAIQILEETLKDKRLSKVLLTTIKTLQEEFTEVENETLALQEEEKQLLNSSEDLQEAAEVLVENFNAIFRLQEINESFELDYKKNEQLQTYCDLLTRTKKFPEILRGNSLLAKKVEEFEKSLDKHQKIITAVNKLSASKLGEQKDLNTKLQQLYPIFSGLSAAVYDFLRLTDTAMFAQWRGRLKRREKETVVSDR